MEREGVYTERSGNARVTQRVDDDSAGELVRVVGRGDDDVTWAKPERVSETGETSQGFRAEHVPIT